MKVAFHTLGCKVNSYETQAISEQFEALGFLVAGFDEKADVYVINTCSVTGEAARKSRQFLNKAKKTNPDAVTVATGCYAQEEADGLKNYADIIIGNNEKNLIAKTVAEYIKNNMQNEGTDKNQISNYQLEQTCENQKQNSDKKIIIEDISRCTYFEEQKISNQGDHVRAYIKIQDGCNRFCSYCIIPYLRGRSRSRKIEDIINEIKNLIKNGYKEIILTGIDISDYKYETGDEEKSGNALVELLHDIDEIKGLERIRLGSLESGIITDDFLDGIKGIKHLCPHFHISLQSGCDAVLQRMNRKYNTADFENSVYRLRDIFDDPGITTDIIVGFPGETEEEFRETLEFVRKMKFSGLHVFKYSRRKGTIADKMNGQISNKEKKKRSDELIKLGECLAADFRKRLCGRECEILAEEEINLNGEKYLSGYTPEYVKLKVPYLENSINKMIKVIPDDNDFIM